MLDLDLRAFLVASGMDYATAVAATAAPHAHDPSTASAGALPLPGSAAAPGPAGGAQAQQSSEAAAADQERARRIASEVESFFFGELAMTEGAPYSCPALAHDGAAPAGDQWCAMRDAPRLKQLLLGAGLLLRVHGPQQVLRGQEALLRARLDASAPAPTTVPDGAARVAMVAGPEAAALPSKATTAGSSLEAALAGDYDGPAPDLDEDEAEDEDDDDEDGDLNTSGGPQSKQNGGGATAGSGSAPAAPAPGAASSQAAPASGDAAAEAAAPAERVLTVEPAPGPLDAKPPGTAEGAAPDAVLTAFTEFPMAS